jgi:hypothetical protein
MKSRDPGSAPNTNDRIPYVYVVTKEIKGTKLLQGERIEHIDYVRKHKLKPDYEFYIENQIMNSILQLYSLIIENLNGYRKGKNYFIDMYPKILRDKEGDIIKAKDRLQDLKEEEVKKLLFDPILMKITNIRLKNNEITKYYNKSLL